MVTAKLEALNTSNAIEHTPEVSLDTPALIPLRTALHQSIAQLVFLQDGYFSDEIITQWETAQKRSSHYFDQVFEVFGLSAQQEKIHLNLLQLGIFFARGDITFPQAKYIRATQKIAVHQQLIDQVLNSYSFSKNQDQMVINKSQLNRAWQDLCTDRFILIA